jgi:hypothetical protein
MYFLQPYVGQLTYNFPLSGLWAVGDSLSVLQVVVAMAVAVAGMLLSVVSGRAESLATPDASFLLFGATDLWRYGQFLYGGTLRSPGGLNSDGFTGPA